MYYLGFLLCTWDKVFLRVWPLCRQRHKLNTYFHFILRKYLPIEAALIHFLNCGNFDLTQVLATAASFVLVKQTSVTLFYLGNIKRAKLCTFGKILILDISIISLAIVFKKGGTPTLQPSITSPEIPLQFCAKSVPHFTSSLTLSIPVDVNDFTHTW